ncbi:MAG TPA: DUF2975 domain-containing protein [Mucilaginibacter sp.]|jgi:hypothetical protein
MKTLGNKSLSTIIAAIINVVWWVEWVVCGAIITIGIITAIVKQGFTLNIPVTFSTIKLLDVSPVNKDFPGGILNSTNGNLFIQIHATWQNIAMLLVAFVSISAMIMIITYQLKVIFSNFKQNLPFNELNFSRIRNIAMVLIVYSVLQWVTVIIVNQMLISNLNWGQVRLTYGFNVGCLFTGLILLIVAEIFKLGVLLEEEKSLTI